MTQVDIQYKNLYEDIIENGQVKDDRTGTGTIAVVGRHMRFDIRNGRVPWLTTKLITLNPVLEMLWFITGDPNIYMLKQHGVGIWDNWLIPGTEEYSPMSEAEIEKALIKAYKQIPGNFDYAITIGKMEDLPEDQREDLYVTIRSQHDDPVKELYIYIAEGKLSAAYKEIIGADPLKLTGGSIGKGGYGPQWRELEDTQMIRENEIEMYEAQGYEIVGRLDDTSPGIRGHGSRRILAHRYIDQLGLAIETLKRNPDSRRIIVDAWNPAMLWQAALPPCHLMFQFISHELTLKQRFELLLDRVTYYKFQRDIDYANRALEQIAAGDAVDPEYMKLLVDYRIHERGLYLDVRLRSNDAALGFPFNVAQYAALCHMVAQCVGMNPMELIWSGVDVHVYRNHVDALKYQSTLEPKDCDPRLRIAAGIKDIDSFKIDDFQLVGYESHPSLAAKMKVAV